MDLKDVLRDEIMGFAQEELILLGDNVELVACSDGRLTWPIERMMRKMRENGQQVRVRRTLGALLNEDTINAIVASGSLKEDRSWVILSHDGCAMAREIEKALKARGDAPGESYKVFFHSLEEHGCKTCAEIEHEIPIVGTALLQRECDNRHFSKKNMVADSVDTPKVPIVPPEQRTLVVTSVMSEGSYENLGLDPKDTSLYYQQNDLTAIKPDVLLSCKELGIKPIRLVSQSVAEDPEIVRVHRELSQDKALAKFGVRIAEPELARSRVGQRYAPRAPLPTSLSASPSRRDRTSL